MCMQKGVQCRAKYVGDKSREAETQSKSRFYCAPMHMDNKDNDITKQIGKQGGFFKQKVTRNVFNERTKFENQQRAAE